MSKEIIKFSRIKKIDNSTARTTETYANINEVTIYNSISKTKFREQEKVERRITRSFTEGNKESTAGNLCS